MPFQGKEHKLTREDSIKGGKARSPAKSIANRLKAIKNCSPKCPLWPCSFQPASEKEFKGLCALKQMPAHVQRRTIDIMTKGSEGLRQHLTDMVNQMMRQSDDGTLKDRFFTIKAGTELAKTFYGTTLRMSGDLNVNASIKGTLTVEEIKKALKEEADSQSSK